MPTDGEAVGVPVRVEEDLVVVGVSLDAGGAASVGAALPPPWVTVAPPCVTVTVWSPLQGVLGAGAGGAGAGG